MKNNVQSEKKIDGSAASAIVVLGAFRSGTSLTAAIVARLGGNFGPRASLYPMADRYNPVGYFQRPEIIAANDSLLKLANSDLLSTNFPLPLDGGQCRAALAGIDLGWTQRATPWAVKDPRFSVTLNCWIDAGIIDPQRLKIIRVIRGTEATARSAVRHNAVGAYCDYQEDKALRMIEAMNAGAAWHCHHIGVPSHTVHYEKLVKDPRGEINTMAAYLEMNEARRIRGAVRLIGKRAALARHYARKFVSPRDLYIAARKTLGF